AGPTIVGLARGAPHDALDDDHVSRALVGREPLAHERHQGLRRGTRAGTERDHGGDRFAPAIVGDADHRHVLPSRAELPDPPSLSSGTPFPPPVWMQTEPRPSSVMEPSVSTRAQSTGNA